jgi:beta-glucosidase
MSLPLIRLLRTGSALLAAGFVSATVLAQPSTAPAAKAPEPVVAATSPEAGPPGSHFQKRHQEILERIHSGPVGLVFLGDSITEGWEKASELWNARYGEYDPANLGISGDTTMGVLWRLENGEVDGIKPRVLVLMLGTNNTSRHDAAQITAGLKKILGELRERLPETKILLLAIFPRGPRKTAQGLIDDARKRMEIIHAVNAELAKLDDGKTVRYLDIGPKFLGPDGKIPNDVMPDQLHPNATGYRIWADAMQPLLTEMLR